LIHKRIKAGKVSGEFYNFHEPAHQAFYSGLQDPLLNPHFLHPLIYFPPKQLELENRAVEKMILIAPGNVQKVDFSL